MEAHENKGRLRKKCVHAGTLGNVWLRDTPDGEKVFEAENEPSGTLWLPPNPQFTTFI